MSTDITLSTEELWNRVNENAEKSEEHVMKALLHAKEMGDDLNLLKSQTPKGQWYKTLDQHCSLSESQARQLMLLARNWKKVQYHGYLIDDENNGLAPATGGMALFLSHTLPEKALTNIDEFNRFAATLPPYDEITEPNFMVDGVGYVIDKIGETATKRRKADIIVKQLYPNLEAINTERNAHGLSPYIQGQAIERHKKSLEPKSTTIEVVEPKVEPEFTAEELELAKEVAQSAKEDAEKYASIEKDTIVEESSKPEVETLVVEEIPKSKPVKVAISPELRYKPIPPTKEEADERRAEHDRQELIKAAEKVLIGFNEGIHDVTNYHVHNQILEAICLLDQIKDISRVTDKTRGTLKYSEDDCLEGVLVKDL